MANTDMGTPITGYPIGNGICVTTGPSGAGARVNCTTGKPVNNGPVSKPANPLPQIQKAAAAAAAAKTAAPAPAAAPTRHGGLGLSTLDDSSEDLEINPDRPRHDNPAAAPAGYPLGDGTCAAAGPSGGGARVGCKTGKPVDNGPVGKPANPLPQVKPAVSK